MKILNRIGRYMARGRSWYQRDVSTITKITVHHSARQQGIQETYEQMLTAHAQAHISRGWPGLAYHYIIDEAGTVYQINHLRDITWHDAVNNDSIGIMLNGYMHAPYNDKPTKKQLASLKTLLDKLCTKHPEFPADHNDVLGHRDRVPTACPGDNLYPYVKEYREKKGKVKWTNEGVDDATPPPQQDKNISKKASYFDKLAFAGWEFELLPDPAAENYNEDTFIPFIKTIGKLKTVYNRTTADEIIELVDMKEAEKEKMRKEYDRSMKERQKILDNCAVSKKALKEELKEVKTELDSIKKDGAIVLTDLLKKYNKLVQDTADYQYLKDSHETNKKYITQLEGELSMCKARTEPDTWLGRILYDLAFGRRPRLQ